MAQMRFIGVVLAVGALVATAGCEAGVEPGSLRDVLGGADGVVPGPASDVPREVDLDVSDGVPIVPSAVLCVTRGNVADGPGPPEVYRVRLASDGVGFGVTLERGFLHLKGSHALPFELDEFNGAAEQEMRDNGAAWTWEGGGLWLDAVGDVGPVRSGTLSWGALADHPIDCWAEDAEVSVSYDGESGRCLDGEGHEGRGEVPLAFIRETGVGVCAVLTGIALEEEDYYYPALEGWDLRGADLRGASLHFAELVDARLEGADLSELSFGYAWITGTVDAHTILPTPEFGGGCELEDLQLSCWQ
jgi:hypothetical protein